jgi:DNA-binding MarR family transcriptional regulator
MPEAATDPGVEAVRRFNRFYTRQIGVLQQGVLESAFSLTEARLIYELAHRDSCTATSLKAELGIDSGYLSRLLRGLNGRGLIEKRRSKSDGRAWMLALTRKGRRAFDRLDTASRRHVGEMLAPLPSPERRRLVGSMEAIQSLLRPGHQDRPA